MNFEIEQISCETTCPYHRNQEGKIYSADEILPQGICPWLYNSVYPYLLGLLYGARFEYNAEGDCNVCCPAAKGVDTLIRLRPNDGSFDPRVGKNMNFVIFAEVVKVHGECSYGHVEGQKFIFPTCMKEHYLCPAAFHNAFPLMSLTPPSCIDKNNLRCPDWANVIPLRVR